ncbi:MAG: hypothetical protein IH608_06285, partial [Proteobacteria bacterium]|nr:hypothetical protein [Pseudomonadota bacterium]
MSYAERRAGTSTGNRRPEDVARWRARAWAAPFLALVAVLALAAFEASGGSGPAADAQRLVGRWVRPDGGYVLELVAIRDDGGVEALYFNPRPI